MSNPATTLPPLGFTLDLPAWAPETLRLLPCVFPDLESRMTAVLGFARRNTEEGTGGPFAAGVFERHTGCWVAFGVNRVMPLSCSSAHAEVMALSLAQHRLGAYDLGGPGMPAYQLVVNWRPCVMCFGAVLWSGIRSLVIAGAGPEMETLTGFDEGPLPGDWRSELARRGIELVEGILQEEAISLFRDFAGSTAAVYNARQGAAL